MHKLMVIVLMGVLIVSCKSSKTENKPLTVKEFLKLYKPANFPVIAADTSLDNLKDTTVDYASFTQFVPDSAVINVLSNNVDKFIIHPVVIIHTKESDYLLTNFTSSKINKLIVFVLDNKHRYKTSLPLLSSKSSNDYSYSVSITNEPTFIIRRDKTGANKEDLYSRNGYAYNINLNSFAPVLNDSNEDSTKQNEIINPIDTLSSLNKFSGDYITDKKNFISVRDGKSANTYRFFIHFEKTKGDCKGELKGEMKMVDAANAIYQESGDPCVIHFKFSADNIKIKEEGNCGNYRGINCAFDFNFKKKKMPKAKAA